MSGQDVGDLPGEVVGVAEPGRQSLADEGWGEMGGVAEEEHPPDLDLGRQPRPEGVHGAANNVEPLEVAAPGPGFE